MRKGDIVVIIIPEEHGDQYVYTHNHSWGVVSRFAEEYAWVNWYALTGGGDDPEDRAGYVHIEYLHRAKQLHPCLRGKNITKVAAYLNAMAKLVSPTAWIADEAEEKEEEETTS